MSFDVRFVSRASVNDRIYLEATDRRAHEFAVIDRADDLSGTRRHRIHSHYMVALLEQPGYQGLAQPTRRTRYKDPHADCYYIEAA